MTADAIRLLSAIGDAFGQHDSGFGMRVANVSARFAVHCKNDAEHVAAAFYAGALHGLGAVRVVVPPAAGNRAARIAACDAPAAGARIAATIEALPRATADAIRWHREAFDGTGFPDGLRWNGIPPSAMAINIARAFVEAVDAQGEYASPPEALFALAGENGRAFSVSLMHAFREFLSLSPETFAAPYEPEWPLPIADAYAIIARICAEIDMRDERTAGRGDRFERSVRAIVAHLGDMNIDADRAAFAGRLTSLGWIGRVPGADDFDPLSRMGRESRAAQAATAERILNTSPGFAPFAPHVGATAHWYDGSDAPSHSKGNAIDPIARVLAVTLAADALPRADAPTRLSAASGTQFDPAVVTAYLLTVASGQTDLGSAPR